MKREMFLISGAAAVLAGCSHHGGSLIPSVGTAGRSQGQSAPLDASKLSPAGALPTQPIVGEVRRFDGATAPQSWAFCDGRTILARDNPALFAILGRSTGGDGKTMFKLPVSKAFTYVIATSGAVVTSPAALQIIFARRPNLDAAIAGVPGRVAHH
jgi:hypothetical protein